MSYYSEHTTHRQQCESAQGHPFRTILGVSSTTLLTATLRSWRVRVGGAAGGQGWRGMAGAVVSSQDGARREMAHWFGEVSRTT